MTIQFVQKILRNINGSNFNFFDLTFKSKRIVIKILALTYVCEWKRKNRSKRGEYAREINYPRVKFDSKGSKGLTRGWWFEEVFDPRFAIGVPLVAFKGTRSGRTLFSGHGPLNKSEWTAIGLPWLNRRRGARSCSYSGPRIKMFFMLHGLINSETHFHFSGE